MSYSTQFLDKIVTVKMDRPMGTRHPEFPNLYYIQNYGYIPGVPAPDGDDLDAYVLGALGPLKEFTGKCIAVIHRTNDEDDKLIVVPEGISYTDDQIRAMTEFQEKYFESFIIRK
ncbi:inorganic diphosphatase [Candidatus Parcubacteria bacterium]|nr:inorganic diphosphatase [Candidatus Parcubacteria bacterium]